MAKFKSIILKRTALPSNSKYGVAGRVAPDFDGILALFETEARIPAKTFGKQSTRQAPCPFIRTTAYYWNSVYLYRFFLTRIVLTGRNVYRIHEETQITTLENRMTRHRLTPPATLAAVVWILPAVAKAAIIMPISLQLTVPANTADPDGVAPYTDDVFLSTLTFDTATFDVANDPFVSGVSVFVASGRDNINAEWGPDDTGADGNPDPFTRAGLNPADQESTDPAIQDVGLASAFFSLSLNEGSDGEGMGNESVLHITFAEGIRDNAGGSDSLPELVLFERGNNDDNTRIRAITGGTFDNPDFAPDTVTVNAGDLWNSGVSIRTNEIGGGQELGVGGIDLSDFGVDTETPVYGFSIASSGADLFGQIIGMGDDDGGGLTDTAPEGLMNSDATVDGPTPVPEPAAWGIVPAVLALAAAVRRGRR